MQIFSAQVFITADFVDPNISQIYRDQAAEIWEEKKHEKIISISNEEKYFVFVETFRWYESKIMRHSFIHLFSFLNMTTLLWIRRHTKKFLHRKSYLKDHFNPRKN